RRTDGWTVGRSDCWTVARALGEVPGRSSFLGRLAGFGSRTARGESRSQWTMKLLAQVRAVLRTKHYSPRTEESYVGWVRRFVRFHGLRHPAELGGAEVERFLSDLAVRGRVAASTQNQALSALLFLYRDVLGRDVGELDQLVRAKRPARLPVVLSRAEVKGSAWAFGWYAVARGVAVVRVRAAAARVSAVAGEGRGRRAQHDSGAVGEGGSRSGDRVPCGSEGGSGRAPGASAGPPGVVPGGPGL